MVKRDMIGKKIAFNKYSIADGFLLINLILALFAIAFM